MGNYERCRCGRLYKAYSVCDRIDADINLWICPKCNENLDDEYKRQQKADQEEFAKSLKINKEK